MKQSQPFGRATKRAPKPLDKSLGKRIFSILFTEPDASVTFWCLVALAAWIAIFLKWG